MLLLLLVPALHNIAWSLCENSAAPAVKWQASTSSNCMSSGWYMLCSSSDTICKLLAYTYAGPGETGLDPQIHRQRVRRLWGPLQIASNYYCIYCCCLGQEGNGMESKACSQTHFQFALCKVFLTDIQSISTASELEVQVPTAKELESPLQPLPGL